MHVQVGARRIAVTRASTPDLNAADVRAPRGRRRARGVIARALASDLPVHVIPEVIAQVWRGGARQARMARLLAAEGVTTPDYDEESARAVGVLGGGSGHAVDVHVVLHALVEHHRVLTSDPDDLRKVDPRLPLIVI